MTLTPEQFGVINGALILIAAVLGYFLRVAVERNRARQRRKKFGPSFRVETTVGVAAKPLREGEAVVMNAQGELEPASDVAEETRRIARRAGSSDMLL